MVAQVAGSGAAVGAIVKSNVAEAEPDALPPGGVTASAASGKVLAGKLTANWYWPALGRSTMILPDGVEGNDWVNRGRTPRS